MQGVKRTSFLSGDGRDTIRSSNSNVNSEDFIQFSDGLDIDNLGRIHSGAAASTSASSISRLESCSYSGNPQKFTAVDSFSKLRCEVLGANIVKSGSRTFAVYSIFVTYVNNRRWTIKRRFRHFEELHQRLKEFPDYNLHLPPKHFLSTSLDVTVVQGRCKLLDIYLKEVMQLPIVSGSIEAWDFLSIDSLTYGFSDLLSIVKTLSGDSCLMDNIGLGNAYFKFFPHFDYFLRARKSETSPEKLRRTQGREPDGSIEVFDLLHDTSDALPTESVPPNLSVPVLDMVGVIFQLQDGGWIR
ncbi:hypothetical protein K1719_037449 [Acacia pycnantha]|nr:hypothetical protein K1719_037449 [Acacia pycnantha]